jgi:hypothetical protein
MTYKGIEYILTPTADRSFWLWQFRLWGKPFSGKTETRLRALAVRRVEQRIAGELKKSPISASVASHRADGTGPDL